MIATSTIKTLIALGIMILILSCLLISYIKMGKAEKIIIAKNDKNLTDDQVKEKIEQLELMGWIAKMQKNESVEKLLRLSKNPYNFTVLTFNLVRYVVPVLCLIGAFLGYLFGMPTIGLALILIVAFLCFFYPNYYCKDCIKEREKKWMRLFRHIWRIKNSLETDDHKKVCISMAKYLSSIGETELSEGFEAYYNLWPENDSDTESALIEFEKDYPFQIAKDFYFVLLETWRSQISANERLDNYREVITQKYEEYCNIELSSLSSKATLFSLPFLLIGAIVAIIVPNILSLIDYL